MNYDNIKSKFIKEKIKQTKWKDRNYIDMLMYLERIAHGETRFGLVTGHILQLRENYPKEWKAICCEVDPEKYKKWETTEKAEKRIQNLDDAKFEQEECQEEQRAKTSWKKWGGRL